MKLINDSKISTKNSQLKEQFLHLIKLFIFLQFPALVLLSIIAWMRVRFDIPVETFMDDPLTRAALPPYTGILSNLGALFWCATGSICLFTWSVLRKGDPAAASFLLYAGIFTLYLLIDDLFLLHELVFQNYLNIPQLLTISGVGVFTILYLLYFRASIIKTNYLILLTSIIFLGTSAFIDQFLGFIRAEFILEDGFKFLGIVTWFGYFGITSLQFIKVNLRAEN